MIFLSYCHDQSAEADKLEAYLKDNHIYVMRDTREMKKNDSISDFMSRIGSSDYAILLISDAYLRSYYCLHEALLAFKNRHRRNIIPVIFPDANCIAPGSGADYVHYWFEEMKKQQEELENLPPQLVVGPLKKLRQIENYCINFSEFLEYIQDNNSICVNDNHWLEETFQCLCERILNREIRLERVQPAPSDLSGIGCDPILSIDFGTSYTLASVLDRNGSTHLIPDSTGNPLRHSTITFTDSGHYRVGSNDQNAIRNIKRLIGQQNSIQVNGEKFGLPLLIAMILKSVIRDAEAYLGCPINQVLMSLPVDFNITEKTILRRSAELAGVHVLRFVPESSIETLLCDSVAPDDDTESRIAMIDLGGGTLDISLVSIEVGVYEILYTNGDRNLGSIDFTVCLEQLLQSKLTAQYGIQPVNLTALAEQAKRDFGTENSVRICYPHYTGDGNVVHLELQVTVEEYEAAAAVLLGKFNRMLIKLQDTIASDMAYYDHNGLDFIFLTGQGTKLHLLRKCIESAFPGVPIVDTYQENAVIRGLSVQSGVLYGMIRNRLLLDAFPSSIYLDYGTEKMLLDANSTIPTRRIMPLEFTKEQYGKSVSVEVFEQTVSRSRHALFQTQFVPLSEKTYEMWLDIDANWRGTIMLLELSNEKDAHRIHYPFDGLYTGLKTDKYTVLYRHNI